MSKPTITLRSPAKPYVGDGVSLTFGIDDDGRTIAIVRRPGETIVTVPAHDLGNRWQVALPDGRVFVIIPAFVVVEYASNDDQCSKRAVVV